MKIEIKMGYNDIKVLKEMTNVVKVKHNKDKNKKTDIIVFKFRDDYKVQVEATNSYIYNSVEFGKNNLAYATIDYVEEKLENTFCFAVWEHDLLDKCRKLLKHKKATVDETCYLVVETHEPNVVRDIPDTEYKTMDKMYFRMTTEEFEENLNVYSLGIQRQDNHYSMVRAIDNLIIDFTKQLKKRMNMDGEEFLNTTPDIHGIDVDYFTQATNFMNLNDTFNLTTFMRYVNRNFYLWKHSLNSDDNVLNKETIIMTRFIDNYCDNEILHKHKELKSNYVKDGSL